MRASTAILCLCIVAAILGCSDNSGPDAGSSTQVPAEGGQSPEDVARAFMEATNTEDTAIFMGHLTEAARQGLETDSGFQMNGGQFESYEVGSATVTADEAEVPVDAVQEDQDQKMKLKMRRENDAWKVYAVAMVISEDQEFTVNFEKIGSMLESMVEGMGDAMQEGFETAFRDAMQGGSAEEIAEKKKHFDAIAAISKEDYEAGWLNASDYAGTASGEAITQLAAHLGLTVDTRAVAAELGRPVEPDVAGLSYLEAIETISRDAGVYPVYPLIDQRLGGLLGAMADGLVAGLTDAFDPENSAVSFDADAAPTNGNEEDAPANAITFAKGERPLPVTFAGPYMVAISDLEENAPHATGTLRLSALGYGLNRGVLTLKQELGETVRIGPVVDAQGRSLKANEDTTYWGGGTIVETAFQDMTSIDLKNLLRDVETIHSISGSRRLALPTAVESIEFTTLLEGVSKAAGEVRVTLKSLGDNQNINFDVTGPEEVLGSLMVQFWPLDAEGNDLGIVYQSADYWRGERAQATLQTSAPPATVRMKLVTAHEVLEYPFELSSVPLSKYAQMPEAIEELVFAGHDAPVDIAFVAFGDRSDPSFPKVTVRATNHSNKKAVVVHAKFIYLDGAGATLKDFPHTLQGTFTADGRQPLAGPGKSSEVETVAFFMPEETSTLLATVEKVEFIDGTTWDASS